jgi:hypothetical protein
LEEYLSELEEITIQFDGINKTLNFVEGIPLKRILSNFLMKS